MTTPAPPAPATAPKMPRGWKPDPTLKRDLPPWLDHRVYGRVLLAPDRYAVRMDGGEPAVWDMQRRCAMKAKEGGRQKEHVRYRINDGQKVEYIGINRLVTEAFYGAARVVKVSDPMKRIEAHHRFNGPGDNKATNLRWVTKSQNLAIERQRPEYGKRIARLRKLQTGDSNSNAKLSFTQLVRIFQLWDYGWHSYREIAAILNVETKGATIVSHVHVANIIKGKSRHDEAGNACGVAGIKLPHWFIIP